MKITPLNEFVRLRESLFNEKAAIEARLLELNQILGFELPGSAPKPVSWNPDPTQLGGKKLTMKQAICEALANGPLTRKELGIAVKAAGYVSKSKNLLSSMGIVLYGKDSPFKKMGKRFYLPINLNPAKAEPANGLRKAKKKPMSSEAKAKIAAGQKRRWALRKQAK